MGLDTSELRAAAHVLARHDLVTGFGHVSQRDGEVIRITAPMRLADITETDLIEVNLDCAELPTDAPPEAWAHVAIYRARPEIGAVVRAMPPSGFAAAAITQTIPALFGQAAWLGDHVPVHPSALLLRTAKLGTAAAATLGSGLAVLLRGNGALTVGDAPGLAVARMWLVEATCRAWLQASAVGPPVSLTNEELAAWRAVDASLLPRLWTHLDAQE